MAAYKSRKWVMARGSFHSSLCVAAIFYFEQPHSPVETRASHLPRRRALDARGGRYRPCTHFDHIIHREEQSHG